ncbi:MAG TPA: pseudouridine synthase [Caulobacteraceae bacterium]|nr:pseudouridine synthase [Caulobacteraceae bacterium]
MVGHSKHRTGPETPGQDEDDDALAGGAERIAKVLARAGVASRREVERLIEAGRVAVNGETLSSPGVRVALDDIVTVDGEVVNEPEPTRLFRYHKPAGLVTTHSDPKGRPTVFAALPEGLPRLISVGRLDLNTEGLLLLTNDGGLARALELPASGVVRRYRARARGRIDQARLDRLKDGITVDGVRYGAIEASLDKVKEGQAHANLWITLTLAEGKNREVRRVLEHLGLAVNRLIRLSYGPFALATLAPGAIEEVGPRVIREQLAQHIAPQNLPKGDRAAWRAPAAQIQLRRAPQEADRPDASAEHAKKTYKPGWARAKAPKNPHGPPRAKGSAKSKAAAKTNLTYAKAPQRPTAKAPGRRPGPGARPAPSSARPGTPAGPRGPRPGAGPGRRG